MGRNKKFNDGQIREIVEYAIGVVTNNGKYPLSPTFSRMDAYRCASQSTEYKSLAYSDIRDDVFTNVKKSYLKNQEAVWGPLPSQMRTPIELEKLMNPRVLLAKHRDDPQQLEEELVKWADIFNHNANKVVMLSNENRSLREDLNSCQSGSGIFQKENEELKQQLHIWKSKYEESDAELKKYKDTIQKIEEVAGVLVLNDCHMGNEDISGIDAEIVTMAKQITYLKDNKREKQDEHKKRILKLQIKNSGKE